jgi:hypothetical protein
VEPPPVQPPPPPVVEPPPPPVVEPPPPPVVEPPPPPVVEPPQLPPELSGAESILGPIGEMSSPLDTAANEQDGDQSEDEDSDEGDDESSVDATLGLVNTGPVNIDQPVDEPITSGGDGGFGDGPGGL